MAPCKVRPGCGYTFAVGQTWSALTPIGATPDPAFALSPVGPSRAPHSLPLLLASPPLPLL
eukprot:5026303-Prorocentrum_lima.AAC.1